MEQRPLRLGDILDDYCPRERRVTNHAVVAMIEEAVRQTRCTTCDTEHAYKGGRAPRRRKKDSTEALYSEVLAGMPDVAAEAQYSAPAPVAAAPPVVTRTAVEERDADDEPDTGLMERAVPPHGGAPKAELLSAAAPDAGNEPDAIIDEEPGSEGPVHRRLIRAQLPRVEGHKEARPLPEFTVRQTPGRGQNQNSGFGRERVRMRQGSGGGRSNGGEPNGNRVQSGRFQGGGSRNGQGRPAGGRGGHGPFRNGQGGQGGKRGRNSRG